TESDAKEISRVHSEIAQINKSEHQQIKRAIRMYSSLSATPREQSLYLLGAFAVIESLLTHDPNGEYDSLGHQIKTKMSLLNSRVSEPLKTDMFGSCAFGKLWSHLYELRSRIAHGAEYGFDKKLKILESLEKSTTFMDQAVKTLLKHALKEPHLVIDLQD